MGTSSLFDDHGNEDEDLSDLEVDPCSITPPDSPAQDHILSSGNGSLPVKDIISAIPGKNFSPHEIKFRNYILFFLIFFVFLM